MSRQVRNLFVAICLLQLATVAWGRGDGTLPLRLPGDGTLPLRLSGDALSMQSPQQRITTGIVISRASKDPLPSSQAGSLTCQLQTADVTKHSASGSVTVGGLSFSIKGICYNQVDQTMEIVGERHANGSTIERSFAAGKLVEEQPRNLNGRLTVTGSSSTAGRYVLDLQSN